MDNTVKQLTFSKEYINGLSDSNKQTLVNHCLLDNYTGVKEEYLLYKINQIYNFANLHIRSNIDYITTVSKRDGIVILHTEMSYRTYKSNGSFPEIIHSFDSENCKLLEMSILYNSEKDSKSVDIPVDSLITTKQAIHQGKGEDAYINKIKIPKEIDENPDIESVTLKIVAEEPGYDHWAHLIWMSIYPTKNISYKIICKDNLTIKNVHIFDNQNGLYYTKKGKNEKGQINEYTITCDEWTDQYTGFALIISEP